MKSIEWLDEAKNKLQLRKDEDLAKALGLSQSMVSLHRTGKRKELTDDACIAIAEVLGIDPIQVIADLNIENSKSERAKKFWLGMVPRGGIEPPTRGFSIHCSTD